MMIEMCGKNKAKRRMKKEREREKRYVRYFTCEKGK